MSHLDKIHKAFEYSSAEFDKSITFIASGAFTISMAFIDKIVDVNQAHCKDILIAAWYCFGGTIFISLLAHYISLNFLRWASMNYVAPFDGDRENEALVKKHNEAVANHTNGVNKRNLIISAFNVTMILTLFAGIVLFIIFIQTNLTTTTMSKEKVAGHIPAQRSNNNGNSLPNSQNHHIGDNIQKGNDGFTLPDQRAMLIPQQPVVPIMPITTAPKSE